ncbi:MAG: hypothetical protein J6S85_10355 [Methanobrevibacter sp.]|nr:hypothetical protein [Methanobrevibacter sp.]
MKKEIMKLVKSEEGTFRLNNISTLRRWSKDGLGNPVDKLVLDFESINHVCFGICDTEIHARDYDGIIAECQEITTRFLDEVARSLKNDMRAGYRNKM